MIKTKHRQDNGIRAVYNGGPLMVVFHKPLAAGLKVRQLKPLL